MHDTSTINCRPFGWNAKYWTLCQVICNLSVFEVWPYKLGVQCSIYIFPSIKTASVVGEGTRCCLSAVDHHKRRQTDK